MRFRLAPRRNTDGVSIRNLPRPIHRSIFPFNLLKRKCKYDLLVSTCLYYTKRGERYFPYFRVLRLNHHLIFRCYGKKYPSSLWVKIILLFTQRRRIFISMSCTVYVTNHRCIFMRNISINNATLTGFPNYHKRRFADINI